MLNHNFSRLSWVFGFIALACHSHVFATEELARKSNCLACHSVASKIVGPSFTEIANRYKGSKSYANTLANKIRQGSVGLYGSIPMPGNMNVSSEDAYLLSDWILSLSNFSNIQSNNAVASQASIDKNKLTVTTLNIDRRLTSNDSIDRIKSILISPPSREVLMQAGQIDMKIRQTNAIDEVPVKLVQGPIYDRVRRILNRMLDSVDIDSSRWTLRIVETEQPTANAFVTGANIIYVYAGLVQEASSDDELAFVLGHEIGHTLLKHVGRNVEDENASIIATLAKVGSLLTKNENAKEILEFTGNSIVQYYSREHEREADAFSSYITSKAGFNYLHANQFFNRSLRKSQMSSLQDGFNVAAVISQVKSKISYCEQQKATYNSMLIKTRRNAEIVNQICQDAINDSEQLKRYQREFVKSIFTRSHPIDSERIQSVTSIQNWMNCRIDDSSLSTIGPGYFVVKALDFSQRCR